MDATTLYKNELVESNIRPTYQRIKILEFLHLNKIHPTSDDIYTHLYPLIPTLSRTTVYNTMKLFVDANIVSELVIDNNEIRYDILTKPHGHFKCKLCNKIYNFEVDSDVYKSLDLKGFKIESKSINVSGICPNCKMKH